MNVPWLRRVREASRRLVQRLAAAAARAWDWLHRLFRRRRPEPARKEPELRSVTEQEAYLPPAEPRPLPGLQDLFAFPLSPSDKDTAFDRQVWQSILLARPQSYRIPDPDFVRVLAMQSVVRTLRWAGPVPDDVPAVVIHREAWNPPYRPPGVEVPARGVPGAPPAP